MNRYFSKTLLLAFATALFSVEDAIAFSPTGASVTRQQCLTPLMAVVDIDGETPFDKTIKSANGGVVIVDYSTTWCGPCKVIAPKFDELSEKYPDVVFLKVIGDASPDASKLMKREGVRSVPSFHYFKDGEKVDVVNGANAEAIEACLTKHLS
ncbi:thioredoxin f [Fragilariopsis cylindrus CCMP1102]|uniref:Thioredoxin f n=1 Tax=Fragilariopsis cylindrus CCMP1102 TaxID=635003 RepID=A0A1E7EMD4_9STRA|nr:thioredoxin f [Fragilariopsis cylindrus CCMP1102]OEU17061.1 thioredoxin f [Fragilariopsis cylindrus CCMP1102]|eukprot:OEU07099.1 thioredoxin f [Fragilariopsis cylindrus CCMP1102]